MQGDDVTDSKQTNGQASDAQLRVGLCQVHTEDWAIEDNLARVLISLEQAAAGGAQIAITPECVLHGYCYDDIEAPDYRSRILDITERLDGPHLAAIREKAKLLAIDVVVGFAERGEGDSIRNAAAFISRDGEILNVYRKIHCRDFESTEYGNLFVPGEEFAVADRSYGEASAKIGTMICFDREIPESVRCLRSLGAEFIACPLATTTYDINRWSEKIDNEAITRVRAAENELAIAVVNHARPDMGGGSFVVGPRGEVLCQMDDKPGVCVVDVPIGEIRSEYHGDPLGWMGWGFRRPELYDKYLSDQQ